MSSAQKRIHDLNGGRVPARFEYDAITGEALRDHLKRLGMDAFAFARLTGANSRTVQYWLSNEKDVPHWVPVMLSLLELPKALGTARMVTASMIREDRLEPGRLYPFRDKRDFPDDGPDWLK
jgi:DNA-binding transcriptional regulator YiaG